MTDSPKDDCMVLIYPLGGDAGLSKMLRRLYSCDMRAASCKPNHGIVKQTVWYERSLVCRVARLLLEPKTKTRLTPLCK